MQQSKVKLSGSPRRPPSPPSASRIRVAVRVRPPVAVYSDISPSLCVSRANPEPEGSNRGHPLHFQHDSNRKTFRFDHVFHSEASQPDVYGQALQPLLASLLHGFNVTVVAYGQTGSGKTFTMGGAVNLAPESKDDDGLMPRFLFDLFPALNGEPGVKLTARVSFLEIYCDEIRDLLVEGDGSRRASGSNLTIHEDPNDVWVEGLRHVTVSSANEALNLLNVGRKRQTTGSHALNDHSSRSHAVYTLEIIRQFPTEIKRGKLTFVDLAGSERVKKTLVEGQRMKESIQINVGLLALGNVINALGTKRTSPRRNSTDANGRMNRIIDSNNGVSPRLAHVPYRSSKLTRLLRDALGGNSVTLFIACVSPDAVNGGETWSTLQYGNRARFIQNKAKKSVEEAVAEEESDEASASAHTANEREIYALRQQIMELKLQLAQAQTAAKVVETRVPCAVDTATGTDEKPELSDSEHAKLKSTSLSGGEEYVADTLMIAGLKASAGSKFEESNQAIPLVLQMVWNASDSTNGDETVSVLKPEQVEKDRHNQAEPLCHAGLTVETRVPEISNAVAFNSSKSCESEHPEVSELAPTTEGSCLNQDDTEAVTFTESLDTHPLPSISVCTLADDCVDADVPDDRESCPSLCQRRLLGEPRPGLTMDQGTQYRSPPQHRKEDRVPVDFVRLPPSPIFQQMAATGAQPPRFRHRSRNSRQNRHKPHPMKLFSLEIDTDGSNKQLADHSDASSALRGLLQRSRALIEDDLGAFPADNLPKVDEFDDQDGQATPLTIDTFVDRMAALYDRRDRQQQRVHDLTLRLRHLSRLLDIFGVENELSELSKLTLQHQQSALQRHLEAREHLVAQRLWTRLQNHDFAVASCPEAGATETFLSEAQSEACEPWKTHHTEDPAFFQRKVLPFVLNGWISVASSDLEAEQLWLAL